MDDNKNNNERSGNAKILLLATLIIIIFLLLSNVTNIAGKFIEVTKPILLGAFFAFLMNPVLVWLSSRLDKAFSKTKLSDKTRGKLVKILSITLTVLFGLLFIVALFLMIIPEAINSVMTIASEAEGYFENFKKWLMSLPFDDNVISEKIDEVVLMAAEYIEKWLTTDLPNTLQTLLGVAIEGVSIVFNTGISLIVAIYIMKDKEKLTASSKRLVFAIFSKDNANWVMNVARHGYKMFGSFLSGKIIDSAIIGLLCFIIMSIFGMSYPLLIGCIIGIFNIIPLFGPYIGGACSALFLLIIDPKMALGFIIMIIALQTFDGNILGPMILGSKTGLSELWITFALLLFGGLFGLFGMILGIPLLAVIFYVIDSLVKVMLKRKELPTESADYLTVDRLTENGFTTLPKKQPKPPILFKNIKRKKKRSPKDKDETKE